MLICNMKGGGGNKSSERKESASLIKILSMGSAPGGNSRGEPAAAAVPAFVSVRTGRIYFYFRFFGFQCLCHVQIYILNKQKGFQIYFKFETGANRMNSSLHVTQKDFIVCCFFSPVLISNVLRIQRTGIYSSGVIRHHSNVKIFPEEAVCTAPALSFQHTKGQRQKANSNSLVDPLSIRDCLNACKECWLLVGFSKVLLFFS